jgi:hypothetical protein
MLKASESVSWLSNRHISYFRKPPSHNVDLFTQLTNRKRTWKPADQTNFCKNQTERMDINRVDIFSVVSELWYYGVRCSNLSAACLRFLIREPDNSNQEGSFWVPISDRNISRWIERRFFYRMFHEIMSIWSWNRQPTFAIGASNITQGVEPHSQWKKLKQ